MKSVAFLSALILLVAPVASAQVQAATPDAAGADAAFERAAALVRDGQGDAGRRIVDSIFVRTRTGTPERAEALYWRAALAMDTQHAEGDYRRLVVEYPLSRRVDRALLALAQLELARNDRERAIAHLQRIEREHPNGETRAVAAFWMARIRFDMNDAPRACTSLDQALRLASADDVELRNQVEFYVPRCDGVARDTSAARRTAAGNAQLPPDARRPAPAAAQVPPDARRSAPDAVQAPADAVAARPYAVQVAAYDTAAEAEALVRRLQRRNIEARVSGTSRPFRVRTGNHATRAEANAALRELRTRGIHGFVVDESATP